MKSSLIIQMPEPCTESWAAMEPTTNGRTCASCERELTDFSRFSNAQLVEFASQHSGKLCGRFAPHQLNRELVSTPAAASLTGLSLPALALMAATLTAQPAHSQEIIVPSTQSVVNHPDSLNRSPSTDRVISGTVLETNSEVPLYGCMIRLMANHTVVHVAQTDFDGHFTFRVPQNTYFDSILVSNTGSDKDTIVPYAASTAGSELMIHLQPAEEIEMIGMVILDKKTIRRNKRHYRKEQRQEKREHD